MPSSIHDSTNRDRVILLAGASGYVGGRLATALSKRNLPIRCMVRRPEEAAARLPTRAAIVKADVQVPSELQEAVKGVHTAFYLIHSMGNSDNFEELDKKAAKNFAVACREAGVKRIIYLGGLGDENDPLSAHLRSRHEVGRELASTGVEVIEFRASVVIGSGSLSFEMVRVLTEKLPVLICPRWVLAKTQPIGVEDLLLYLIAAIDLPTGENRIFEVGGKDVVSYEDLMKEYAKQRNLKRIFIRVPFLTPRLSSLWLGLVTPLYARVGHKLITSIKNSTVVRHECAKDVFSIRPRGMQEAIRRAFNREDQEFGHTHWSDALSSLGETKSWAGVQFGSRIVDSREVRLALPLPAVFDRIRTIGGETGWYFGNFLWRIRGFIDRLIGGPGLRRGRRHPSDIRVGDAIDFWRVEAFQPNKKLRLRAEMKVPGRAWLEFRVEANKKNGDTHLTQTAIFDPVGVCGRLYWYALYPIHAFIFQGMLNQIAVSACQPLLAGKKSVGEDVGVKSS